jgi:hypothetical protein
LLSKSRAVSLRENDIIFGFDGMHAAMPSHTIISGAIL